MNELNLGTDNVAITPGTDFSDGATTTTCDRSAPYGVSYIATSDNDCISRGEALAKLEEISKKSWHSRFCSSSDYLAGVECALAEIREIIKKL